MRADERYDTLFKWYVEQLGSQDGLDYRLVKEQCREESAFDPKVVSSSGAVGLMQLMPVAAQQMNVVDRTNPEESIRGGVAYLVRMYHVFQKEQGFERWKFALGAYNSGLGNVIGAQVIAERRGLDPSRWVSVVQVLSDVTGKLSEQTVNYVARITQAYEAVVALDSRR